MGDRLAETSAERARMNLDLLQRLALAVTANEKAQRRFRTAMLIRVSKIETTLQMMYGAQIAQAHNCADSEAMKKHVRSAEEMIAETSDRMVLATLRFIYDESAETAPQRGRRRQWSNWEI